MCRGLGEHRKLFLDNVILRHVTPLLNLPLQDVRVFLSEVIKFFTGRSRYPSRSGRPPGSLLPLRLVTHGLAAVSRSR